ncbi:apolipoprotein D-like [Macrobrachium nipponense]|uniref:apolipoprotein D-like n=1 Tax=Macrobrachium nipponense TaxID=159736 RepID=UPI0030C8CC75
MKCHVIILRCLTLAVMVSVISAELKMGKCKTHGEIDSMDNFDITKFVGEWYVVQGQRERGKCIMNYFFLRKSGKIKHGVKKQYDIVHKHWQLAGLFSVHHQKNHVLFLTEGQENCKSHIVANRLIITTNYYILETDYDSYALLYRCENFIFFRNEYAAILSRTWRLDPSIIKRLQKSVEKFGIKPEDFNRVYFHDCDSEDA